ncbi:MAG: preprotein translocase subunit SecA [Pseudomonadales bacterium]
MIGKLFKAVVGTKNDRELKRLRKVVKRINAFEEDFEKLRDVEIQGKTEEFRERLKGGESLDNLLPDAFALVREASKRTLGLRHFDVQMIGGYALHEGNIAEMRTGEGKTLVATLPAYLNALSGEGVHLVTVNDYLAERDANWMRPIYEMLGLTVGVILSGQDQADKHAAYNSDITYGTNNEFGFDYLRDNMAFSSEDRMQNGQNFAIVDEVDSILIDEARTPLIISGAAEDSSALYKRMDKFIKRLQPDNGEGGHYTLDEKQRHIELTEEGHQFVEELLTEDGLLEDDDNLYAPGNLNLLHHVNSALRAHVFFNRNVEYIVQNNRIVLIDEHTGRTMPGRRLSEGLHQAIEAKEKVEIQAESQTLASTTFQNYFRLYNTLSGMTGTADTEAFEFQQIYGLDVLVIPTNLPTIRNDLNDLVFLSKEEKFEAILEDIKVYIEQGSPVLVGTASIESSEELSNHLEKSKIDHKVLNAKFHQQEAEIIAQAGRPAAITIATNMAGRGTDIVLGGNLEAELASHDNLSDADRVALTKAWQERHDQVIENGGLHILATERHESRRIDNQLRGRAGRQGDPGVTRFYLSLEDNLMRIFASDRVKNFMQALGMERGEAIEHRMVSNAIEKAQRKVEGRNFDIRKQLLEYDDVANDQRQVVYRQRNEVMESSDISDMIEAIRSDVISDVVDTWIPRQSLEEQWDVEGLEEGLRTELGLELPVQQWLDKEEDLHEEPLRERIEARSVEQYDAKMLPLGEDARKLEKHVMLQVLDQHWKEHLATMDHLRQGIHLRAYAAKNPKQEYKRESFELFQSMLEEIKHEVVRFLARVEIRKEEDVDAVERQRRAAEAAQTMEFQHDERSALDAEPAEEEAMADGSLPAASVETFKRAQPKVGRNEPCSCGSGKKYKHCHGKL